MPSFSPRSQTVVILSVDPIFCLISPNFVRDENKMAYKYYYLFYVYPANFMSLAQKIVKGLMIQPVHLSVLNLPLPFRSLVTQ